MMPEKLDRSISVLWANILSILFTIPVLIIFLPAFIAIWGTERAEISFVIPWSMLVFILVIFFVGIIVHEALYGLTWQWLSGKRNVVEYGVKWKLLTPYAHLTARISASAYRMGVAMPGMVLRVIPAIIAIILGNFALLWFGILFTWSATGDALVLWLLRDVPHDAEIEDHPSRVGCYLWLSE